MHKKTVINNSLGRLRQLKAETEEELARQIVRLEQQWKAECQQGKHLSVKHRIDYETLPELQVHKTPGPSFEATRIKIQANRQSIVIGDLANLLIVAETTNNRLSWDKLPERLPYPNQPPIMPEPPESPKPAHLLPLPNLPRRIHKHQFIDVTILDNLLVLPYFKKVKKASGAYAQAMQHWQKQYSQARHEYNKIKQANRTAELKYQDETDYWVSQWATIQKCYTTAYDQWLTDKQQYHQKFSSLSLEMKRLQEMYYAGEHEAIRCHAQLILSRSAYPPVFPRNFMVEYDAANRILFIDYQLPTFDGIDIYKVTAIGQKVPISDQERKSMQQNMPYMLALRTLHEVIDADEIDAIRGVAFNGWTQSTEKTETTIGYQLPIYATKAQIVQFPISRLIPKDCFVPLASDMQLKQLGNIVFQPTLTLSNRHKHGKTTLHQNPSYEVYSSK